MLAGADDVRRLQRKWFGGTPDITEAVHRAFDQIGFTEAYVHGRIQAAIEAAAPPKDKVIKDSVWGMVEVDQSSGRLLDSPIIQRLRSVKQLGFTFFTYPSAEHSRFIHSLGMYAVIRRFLEAMERPGEEERVAGFKRFHVSDDLTLDLVHAAILHDSGHMPFSHATEVALATRPDKFFCGPMSVEDFQFDVEDYLKRKIHLSECLSLAIVLSPRFEKFYLQYVRRHKEDRFALSRIAALIAGLPPEPRLRGPAQLISTSPVDADKVDYITRDALACGIPVGIDVARLFLRSAFIEVPTERLRKLLPGEEVKEEQVIFVVNASGMDTIEELAHARASLYQRVYLHQTTRNAERLLARCMDALPAGRPELLRDAFNLLSLDDSALLRQLANHSDPQVVVLGSRLRNRDLPKRACVFSRTMADMVMNPKDVFEKMPQAAATALVRQTLGKALQLLLNNHLAGENLSELENAIRDEAIALAGVIRARNAGLAPKNGPPAVVSILPMTELPGLNKDCVVLENRELTHSSTRSISDEQTDAADIYKSLGYVLTDAPWREIVCLATRKVVEQYTSQPRRPTSIEHMEGSESLTVNAYCEGRVLINLDGVVRRAGLNSNVVKDLQSAAEDGGYYDSVPYLSVPRDDQVEAIAKKVRDFSGQGTWQPTHSHCSAFLSQFPPKLRPLISAAFSNFELLDPATTARHLVQAVEAFKKATGPTRRILLTGLSPDSGNMVRMFFEHYAREKLTGVEFKKSLNDALADASNEDALLLCDDNIGSGSQAQAQFRAWFGVPRDKWPESQRTEGGIYATALPENERELLKRLRFGVAACVGKAAAGQPLLNAVRDELGAKEYRGLFLGKDLDDAALVRKQPPELYQFMRAVGAQVLGFCRYGTTWDKLEAPQRAACEKDGAGYRDAQWLLATPFNVPTSTFTALWCPGTYQGRPWIPLLMRRGYLKHLVVT